MGIIAIVGLLGAIRGVSFLLDSRTITTVQPQQTITRLPANDGTVATSESDYMFDSTETSDPSVDGVPASPWTATERGVQRAFADISAYELGYAAADPESAARAQRKSVAVLGRRTILTHVQVQEIVHGPDVVGTVLIAGIDEESRLVLESQVPFSLGRTRIHPMGIGGRDWSFQTYGVARSAGRRQIFFLRGMVFDVASADFGITASVTRTLVRASL